MTGDRSPNDIWHRTIITVRNVALKVFLNAAKNFDASKIDPLPTTKNDVFRGIGVNETSEDELSTTIKSFIEKGQVSICGKSKTLHRKEGLEKLLTKLQKGRKDLNEIVKKLETGSGMSEEAAERLVSRFLFMLGRFSNLLFRQHTSNRGI